MAGNCGLSPQIAGNPARAQRAVESISAAGGTTDAFAADVADEEAVGAMFDHAEQLYGGIDVVVNTAGIMLLSPIAALELADLDRTPGPTATPLFVDGKDEAAIASFAKITPLERLGQPGDIAECVAFLAGPARWSTGRCSTPTAGWRDF